MTRKEFSDNIRREGDFCSLYDGTIDHFEFSIEDKNWIRNNITGYLTKTLKKLKKIEFVSYETN